ncbi:MAG: TetR/AcrR family transcriptional regulator [Pseudomonadota bacterium]
MAKGARTRATILRAAVETASLGGFVGLNLQPLADRVGMTKSGLYAHFGSKEALQLATLEYATELFQSTVVLPAKTEAAGLPRLAGIYERWLGWPANAGLSGQCPFFAAVVEFDDGEGPLRERLTRLFRDFRGVIEQLAASAMRHGHLPGSTDVAQFAHELLALRYAHHWAAGFMREPAALQRARTGFARLTASVDQRP